MPDNPSLKPIFVHASPRSGSTYIFNVLRRMGPLLCFDEPISDDFTYFGKNEFIGRVARGQWNWSHSFLERYSQAEFVDAWDNVMHLYPPAPAFRDYVPQGGVLPNELRRYLSALINYASMNGKRAALCEIYSRGRVGALRDTFGGFHVAQFRDPLCQFGSSFRALQEFGAWIFIITPLRELGLSGEKPLYSIIPEGWRVPALPWPAEDRAQRWATTEQHLSMILSSDPSTLEKVFRWHLLSWFLHNLAAIVHSDFVLDIDKAHDDLEYREFARDIFHTEIGVAPDFTDLTKFPRYYGFEGVDIVRLCDEIVTAINNAQDNGQLEAAIASLGRGRPTVSSIVAINTLRTKLDDALAQMASTDNLIYVTNDDWKSIVRRHRHVWANPQLRSVMRHIYPVALPIVQAARTIGLMQ
jgi:hypothetical protein